MSFEIIDDLVSGDYAFEARGRSIEELFTSCAEACFSAMTDLGKVDVEMSQTINVDAENIDELLFNFLAELIYLKDTEKLFLSKFEIDIDIEKYSLNSVARGERINYNKHEIRTDVKAVTYHNLQVQPTDDGFKVRVILDL
jgi:SHS2 domain-containing protein